MSKTPSGNILDLILSVRPEMFKTALWKRPLVDFELEARNALKLLCRRVLDLILSVRPKYIKTAFRKCLERDFEGEARNIIRPSRKVLDLILSVRPEISQNSLLEASWI